MNVCGVTVTVPVEAFVPEMEPGPRVTVEPLDFSYNFARLITMPSFRWNVVAFRHLGGFQRMKESLQQA